MRPKHSTVSAYKEVPMTETNKSTGMNHQKAHKSRLIINYAHNKINENMIRTYCAQCDAAGVLDLRNIRWETSSCDGQPADPRDLVSQKVEKHRGQT
jgi:hypothetical protein